MSVVILKSPRLLEQRLKLGEACQSGHGEPARADVVDPRQAIETQVREELEARLQDKLNALREEAMEAGYKEGFAVGHQEGLSAAQDAFKNKQAVLEALVAAAETQIDAWTSSLTERAVELGQGALCQLLGEEALNPGLLQGVIDRMTQGLRQQEVLSVRLHPTDCNVLRRALKPLTSDVAASQLLSKLHDDPTLETGGVVVEMPRGEYRATLDVQLQKLSALVAAQRHEHTQGATFCHAVCA